MSGHRLLLIAATSVILIARGAGSVEIGRDGEQPAPGSNGEARFSLFSIVQFKNEGCATQSTSGGIARNGTCYTSTECQNKGGQASGNCAAGFDQ